ncbi:unnamed protein product [Albugo candida]|uniref:Uncharacterized protein n=1 Tax=Albugo candida TaxID=65357 RepID=A0A024GMR2_9STRA|nr:unnamed protein product [Albugo candida]|eukprot:CCI47633.1 unnamed protein product [Albugo candida]
MARKHFDKMKEVWASEVSTTEHSISKMMDVYDREITVEKSTRFMRARKLNDRSCTEQH